MLPRTSKLLPVDWLRRRPGLAAVAVLLPLALLASFYAASSEEAYQFEPRYPLAYEWRLANADGSPPDGYLVWNPRCQMVSKEPLDRSIRGYARKEKYESCSGGEPLLTGLSRGENGSVILFVDPAASARHPGLECCWSPISRAERKPEKAGKDVGSVDSSIVVKKCEGFEGETAVPEDASAVLASCTRKQRGKQRGKPIYRNVHAVLHADRVRDRLRGNGSGTTPAVRALSRKLSVLVLGIDSVSRLNFMRSAPTTAGYLRETGWVRMNGYNKMGDNTFPNLMAILTGQSQAQAYSACKPTVPRNLDRCPFLWRDFREAGYATAYGEDEASLNTFNYLKVGFVEPPTDYYLRPYILACEKLLKAKKRFGLKHCTGPESSFDRILDYATEFARAFLGLPYFGLFWTVSVSHENANGLSSMDERLRDKLEQLERGGVLEDALVVLLSDHGMRWGPIRNTFVGWYEERLPFLYVRLPEWFREERPDALPSLLANQHRLLSPFDLYETFRDALALSGGRANPSSGCPACRSLIAGPVPWERGCEDAGISSHWCACSAFRTVDPDDPAIQKGARVFLDRVNAILDGYRGKKGRRLCAKLRLKKVHRVDRVLDFGNSSTDLVYFYMIQLTPGDGKFEVTLRYRENGTYALSDHEVSRINPYAAGAECLERGMKQYCHCLE